ncbi:MAG: hypothetical protein KAX78_10735 [Phycisphaerae bacterium]|nr:hypothetical protein [Phycisphaerae bacterium]
MSPEGAELDLSGEGKSDFVPVVYARSLDDAEQYRSLLEDHDIPAMVGTDEKLDDEAKRAELPRRRGVPVMVPEVLLDEASEVIADREDLDEFAPQTDETDEHEDEDDELELQEPLDDRAEDPLDDEEDLLDDIETDSEDDESGHC